MSSRRASLAGLEVRLLGLIFALLLSLIFVVGKFLFLQA
jgi:hypothetical protein